MFCGLSTLHSWSGPGTFSVCFQAVGLQRMQTDVTIHLAELTLGMKIYFKKKSYKTCEPSWHAHVLRGTGAAASLREGRTQSGWLLPRASRCKLRARAAGSGPGRGRATLSKARVREDELRNLPGRRSQNVLWERNGEAGRRTLRAGKPQLFSARLL